MMIIMIRRLSPANYFDIKMYIVPTLSFFSMLEIFVSIMYKLRLRN